ncbi:ImmA/IrrE family metallo-endopeptidase [Curtobacterium flaccumfaciens]|uniref:ImmA/IrrE family metallo-endopeptidase n=1 Tax=Curtobacterium flaccumfaciens TaxID=2035 RepID=UPI00220C472E|nr:ImmA/IrrE family metallo-endopeptidase [Curtobacterium flaccumfaciens]UWD79256.1 ImmA/IrrE family metallo-endopeptidase [Curtobacterium flaccumfaciens]
MLEELHARYDDVDGLTDDPLQWVECCADVALVLDEGNVAIEHGVFGRYDAEPTVPRIIVAAHQSRPRQQFTVLHEYGHHLLRTTPAFADELVTRDDFGTALEERACDVFAARVLIPEGKVADVLGTGVPTAAAVVAAWANLPAVSMHAVMIRAIANFTAEGYVLFLDENGAVLSCVVRDAPPVAVGSDQSATTIWKSLHNRDTATSSDVRFLFQGVPYGDNFYAQAKRLLGGAVLVVAARERVPWQLSVRRQEYHVDRRWWTCERCSHEFEVEQPPCRTCNTPVCPSCSHCACGATLAEFTCTECFIRRPPSQRSETADVCKECAA